MHIMVLQQLRSIDEDLSIFLVIHFILRVVFVLVWVWEIGWPVVFPVSSLSSIPLFKLCRMDEILQLFTSVMIRQKEFSSCGLLKKRLPKCIRQLECIGCVEYIHSSVSASEYTSQASSYSEEHLPIHVPDTQLPYIHNRDPLLYLAWYHAVLDNIFSHDGHTAAHMSYLFLLRQPLEG